MNCIKAKLISVKNRLVRVIQRRRRSTASRRTETPRRRIASLLKMRLRLRLQRRQREQRAASREQEQCEAGSAPSVEDDATSARFAVEVEIPTTPSLTNTPSLSSFTSLSPTSFTTSSDSSDDEEDYVDDSDLSSVYSDCEQDEEEEDGNIVVDPFDLIETDDESTDYPDSLSSYCSLSLPSADNNDGEEEDLTEVEAVSLREQSALREPIWRRTTYFGGEVIILSQCSSEEDLSGNRDQERASGVENRELHQTNLSDNNVFQWWEDRLHSAVELCTSRDDDAVSQTSSMEELRSIFGNDNNEPSENVAHSEEGHQTSTQQNCYPESAFSLKTQWTRRIGDFVETGRFLTQVPHYNTRYPQPQPKIPFFYPGLDDLEDIPDECFEPLEKPTLAVETHETGCDGAAALPSEAMQEEELSGDRDQERASGVENRKPRQCDTRNQFLLFQQQLQLQQQQLQQNATNMRSEVGAGNDGHSTNGQQTSTLQYHVPGSAFSGAGCNPRIGQFVELGRHFTTYPHHLPTNYHHDPYLPFTHHSTGQMPQYQQASQQYHSVVQPTGQPDEQYYSGWNCGQHQQSLQGAVGAESFSAYIVIPDAPPVPVDSTAPPQSTAASHGISKLITEQKTAPLSNLCTGQMPQYQQASQQYHGLVQPTGPPDQQYYSGWNCGQYQQSLQEQAARQLPPARMIVPNAPPVPVQSTAPPQSTAASRNIPKLVTEHPTPVSQLHTVPGLPPGFSRTNCNPNIGQYSELGQHFTTYPHHLTTNYHHDPYLTFTHHSTGQMPQYQQASQPYHDQVQSTGQSDQQYYSIWNMGC